MLAFRRELLSLGSVTVAWSCWSGGTWVFFFKQKTAYEMRISDWSSDVCSSDLPSTESPRNSSLSLEAWPACSAHHERCTRAGARRSGSRPTPRQIGRASCRERVCQYV